MARKCPQCDSENTDTARFCSNCATPLPGGKEVVPTITLETPTEELTRGSVFAGRYEIIEELGKGGMGRVYRVEDIKLRQEVALKLIKPEIAKDKKTIERFRNELKLAREIAHRNVCRMYDLNEEKGTHYITMEYVRGEDLRSSIRRFGQLPIGKSISIAKQICEGLVEAHRSGVVHRDLKSNNIMIDKEGNVRIMDFGIARSLESKGITGAGVMIGTPEYMSPEQVEGKEVDQRSDIYSLGVILYEMLTGRVPFEGDTPFTIGVKHKSEIPKDPKELNTQIPEDLNSIIMRCLEKDKEKRYQSAAEVRSELDNIEKGIPTTEKIVPETKPLTSKEVIVKFKKSRVLIAVPLVIILVVVGYLIFGPKKSQREQTQDTFLKPQWKNSIAVLPFTDLSPQRDQDHFCGGMTEDIIGRLSRISDLKVISRTSVVPYKNTDKTPQDIGQELKVAYILEGSIQREEEAIRVTSRLIDANSGFQLWSGKYNRQLESLFAVQDEISLAIAEALKVELTQGVLDDYKSKQPTDMKLYELYMRGVYYLSSKYVLTYREEDFKKALEIFEEARKIDPSFSKIYTGLAWAYFHRYQITEAVEDIQQFMSNAEKAYKLDPSLAESNVAQGFLFYLRGEFDEASQKFRIALQENPNILETCQSVAYFLYGLGLYRMAIPLYLRATEVSPSYLWAKYNISWCFLNIGEYEKAEYYLKDALNLNPKNPFSLIFYADHQAKMGKYDEAAKLIEEVEEITPDFRLLPRYKATLLAALGRKDEALSLYRSEVVYSLLGMKDEAIEFMLRSREEGQRYAYIRLDRHPYYKNLRDDPRFQKIMAEAKKTYELLSSKYRDLK